MVPLGKHVFFLSCIVKELKVPTWVDKPTRSWSSKFIEWRFQVSTWRYQCASCVMFTNYAKLRTYQTVNHLLAWTLWSNMEPLFQRKWFLPWALKCCCVSMFFPLGTWDGDIQLTDHDPQIFASWVPICTKWTPPTIPKLMNTTQVTKDSDTIWYL